MAPKALSLGGALGAAWQRWPVVLALTAIVISLPSLGAGLLNDDYCQRAVFVGPSEFLDRLSKVGLAPESSGSLSTGLFDQFVTVDPEKNLGKLRSYGALPWWTCDDLRVAFWRPVASFTHWLDYRLFPDSLALMHYHSILWFAGAVLAVSVLYRRLIGVGGVAFLAALMYLLADFSYFPMQWLANRNVLISLCFGACTLILHDHYRNRSGRFGWAAAPACLLLSVLSAEAGIATVAYLFAYEFVMRRDRWTSRLRALALFAVVIVGWRVVYNILGYGAGGGAFYLDPVREPVRYALAVLDRAPVFLAGQWTTLPPELSCMVSGVLKQALWGVLLFLTVAIPAIMWPMIRVNRRARFWLTGMYLSVLPVCATVPMSRALIFIAIGAFGLIAELAGCWWAAGDWVPTARWRWSRVSVLAVALLVAHLPWAAVRRAAAPHMVSKIEKCMARTKALHLLWWWRGEDLVLVNAPNPATLFYDPFRNAYNGRLLPGGIRTLAPGFGALAVTRTEPNRLVVRAASRSLLDGQDGGGVGWVHFYEALSDVRGADRPMQAGQRIILPRMTVEVLAVDGRGLPIEAAFDFPVPLEDSSLQWIYWDWRRRDYAVFHVPAVGRTVSVAGPWR